MSIVTCQSPGCANYGIPIPLNLSTFDPVTGEPLEVTVVFCGGGCGQQLTVSAIDEQGGGDGE